MAHVLNPVKKEDLTPAPGTTLVVYAENQPEYIPLPARRYPDGSTFHEWSITEPERQALIDALLEGKELRIRVWQWTFNQPLQPVRVELV